MLTVRNYIEAAKRRKKEETGEEGFSLIELIIVVVILGILVAIAIPVFLNIQEQARENAVKSAAANGATQSSAAMAKGSDATAVSLANLENSEVTTVTLEKPASGTDIDTVCVSATNGTFTWYAGPGALTDGSACK